MTHRPDPDPNPTPDDTDADTEREGPFTDYGQFGHGVIDTRVVWQTHVWVDIAGRPVLLTDMATDYRRNVIGYLRRRAPDWWLQAVIDALGEVQLLLEADAPADRLEPALQHLAQLRDLGTTEWIETTPLMRRLRQLTPDNP